MPKTTLEQALFQRPPVRGFFGPQTLVNNDVCLKKCTPTVFEALWLPQGLRRALPEDWPRTHLRLQTLCSVHQYKTNPLPDNCFVGHRHTAIPTHLPLVTQESAQTLQPRATLLRENKNKLEKNTARAPHGEGENHPLQALTASPGLLGHTLHIHSVAVIF